jgi:hypothetical protein
VTDASRQARHYAKHGEKCRAQWRAWSYTDAGTASALLRYARRRATDLELQIDLDRGWVLERLQAGVCEFTGFKFQRGPRGDHAANPYAPSIDRIKPELGYLKGNCRLVVFAFNRFRCDGFGDDVMIDIAAAILKRTIF